MYNVNWIRDDSGEVSLVLHEKLSRLGNFSVNDPVSRSSWIFMKMLLAPLSLFLSLFPLPLFLRNYVWNVWNFATRSSHLNCIGMGVPRFLTATRMSRAECTTCVCAHPAVFASRLARRKVNINRRLGQPIVCIIVYCTVVRRTTLGGEVWFLATLTMRFNFYSLHLRFGCFLSSSSFFCCSRL